MWSIDSSMHWWLYRGWFPGTCTDHKLKPSVVTGHWLSMELSSKHHEGRSALILCVWCGTWGGGGWMSCDKSAVLCVSCLPGSVGVTVEKHPSMWSASLVSQRGTTCSYVNATPGDAPAFLFFPTHYFPSHILSMHYQRIDLRPHASPPPPRSTVTFAAGVSVYESAHQSRPLHLEADMVCWYLLSEEER